MAVFSDPFAEQANHADDLQPGGLDDGWTAFVYLFIGRQHIARSLHGR